MFLEVIGAIFFGWVKYCYIVFKSIWKTWQKWDEKLKPTFQSFKHKKKFTKKINVQSKVDFM
jgi:hypothetical protein